MKQLLKKFDNYKKPKHSSLTNTNTLGSSPGPEPATSTLTIATPTVGCMPSIPDSTAIVGWKVIQATGVTVSIQIGPSHP